MVITYHNSVGEKSVMWVMRAQYVRQVGYYDEKMQTQYGSGLLITDMANNSYVAVGLDRYQCENVVTVLFKKREYDFTQFESYDVRIYRRAKL